MSLGITCKGARNVKQLRPMDIEAARTKFLNECGVRVEDIGGIVIDEVSFIAAGVYFVLAGFLMRNFHVKNGPSAAALALSDPAGTLFSRIPALW